MAELEEALKVVRAAGYTVLEGEPETVTEWAVFDGVEDPNELGEGQGFNGGPSLFLITDVEQALQWVASNPEFRIARRPRPARWVEVPAEENSRG